MSARAARSRGGRSARDAETVGYGNLSRHPALSILAVLPVFLLHEVGARLMPGADVNAARWVLLKAFVQLGPWGLDVLRGLAVVAILLAMVVAVRRHLPFHWVCPLIALEGVMYGLVLGPVALWLASGGALAAPSAGRELSHEILLSLGAGLYEELLFRLGLLSALAVVLARAAAGWSLPRMVGHVAAVLLSAVLFALFHHLGPGSEPFDSWRMLFRTAAGVLLGGLFVVRGFGVVVYCHTAYDVLYFLRASP